MFHAVIDKRSNKAVGFATFMRIDPVMGAIEVGNINFSPALQRTPAATEAMFLMMAQEMYGLTSLTDSSSTIFVVGDAVL